MTQQSGNQQPVTEIENHADAVKGHTSPPSLGGGELTLAEAATLFTVSQATLRRLVSAGMLPAREVSGVRGREWRLTAQALEEAGYKRRTAAKVTSPEAAEVRRLTEALGA